ncbi:MAG: DMT family transporter [Bacillota bacterium]
MKQQELRSNLLLLTAAAIWGFAFVAQRVGVRYMGSFTFNGIRFALGSLSLLPLLLYSSKKESGNGSNTQTKTSALPAGIIAGFILFLGASLQQLGLVSTSAGKAAFITGLYIVLVPLLGIFLKHRTHPAAWLGVFMAAVGLYFLSVTGRFIIVKGDLLELAGSFFWAVHILVIDHFTKKVDALRLCIIQFLTCAVLSLGAAVIFEIISLHGLMRAAIPILYGGVCSVGVAYTLQVFGQRHAKPAHSAIILSMETVFAALGGLIILGENLGGRGYLGCLLMLAGMFLSQLPELWPNNPEVVKTA